MADFVLQDRMSYKLSTLAIALLLSYSAQGRAMASSYQCLPLESYETFNDFFKNTPERLLQLKRRLLRGLDAPPLEVHDDLEAHARFGRVELVPFEWEADYDRVTLIIVRALRKDLNLFGVETFISEDTSSQPRQIDAWVSWRRVAVIVEAEDNGRGGYKNRVSLCFNAKPRSGHEPDDFEALTDLLSAMRLSYR